MGRLNPHFQRFKDPVKALSGGQRQSVAIARAILFNAQILIMDEPTAALGPQETAQVCELVKQIKAGGIGIFLISHDIHDVFDLADRICAMKNGRIVGTARVGDVTKDEVLGMIILGKCPPRAIPRTGRDGAIRLRQRRIDCRAVAHDPKKGKPVFRKECSNMSERQSIHPEAIAINSWQAPAEK